MSTLFDDDDNQDNTPRKLPPLTATDFEVIAGVRDPKTLDRKAQRREEKKTGLKPTKTTETTQSDLATIAALIRDQYTKYILFHTDHTDAQAGTMTLYTLYSYVYDVFRFAPILMITAATSESGKSRLVSVAKTMMRDPRTVGDATAAALLRLVEKHTTIISDEGDMTNMTNSLRTVFNLGVEKGYTIPRAGKTAGEVIEYNPFGPKIVAGIHGDRAPLTGPTLDRAITIMLRKKLPGESEVEDFDATIAHDDAEPIRRFLENWWQVHGSFDTRPKLPSELGDRQRDAWRPLITLADEIGWGKEARAWAVELSALREVAPDVNVQILRDVYAVLQAHQGDRITTRELAVMRNNLTDAQYPTELDARRLGMRLRALGLPAVRDTFNGRQDRGQVFKAGGRWTPQWQDAIDRYRLS